MSDGAVRVDLFGVQCNTDVADSNGVVWSVLTPLSGWTSPQFVSDRARITGGPGTVTLDGRHAGRVLMVQGHAWAPSQAIAWEAYNQLNTMPGAESEGEVVVHEPTPKSLTVRLEEEPRAQEPAAGHFEFILTLVANHPYKRSIDPVTVSIAAGATVSLDNDGTAPAFLTVQATGSGTVQVRQNDSGQVLRSKASVSSGTTFNGTTKRVTSSGGAVLLGVVGNPSEWLSIPRLATTPVTNQGTAPVEVTYYHAYA